MFTVRYGLTVYRSQCNLTSKEAVPWFRRLVTDRWLWGTWFGSKTLHLGYVRDKM